MAASRTHVYWTTAEERILREHAGESEAELQARLPRHTAMGIRCRRKKLGLPSGWKWTAEDDAALRETIHLPAREVAGRLGRSLAAVNERTRRLGLRRRREWRPEEAAAARRRLDEGATLAQVAAELGRSRFAVWWRVRARNAA